MFDDPEGNRPITQQVEAIDGVALFPSDVILLVAQQDSTANGIWVIKPPRRRKARKSNPPTSHPTSAR